MGCWSAGVKTETNIEELWFKEREKQREMEIVT